MEQTNVTNPETHQPEGDLLNLDDLDPWLETNITKPFPGFEEREHEDHTRFTETEAIEDSRNLFRQQAKMRHEVVELMNVGRTKKGLDPLTQEQFDQEMKENFRALAEVNKKRPT